MNEASKRLFLALVLAATASACASRAQEIPLEALALPPQQGDALAPFRHRGPAVVAGETGPARFARAVHRAFDVRRAHDLVVFIEARYRAPANEGYDEVLERIAAELRAGGFGDDPRFELFEIATPLEAQSWENPTARAPAPAWTPEAGRIALRAGGREAEVLHAFSAQADRDRVMLPVYCPSAQVEGPVALGLDELEEGEILVIDAAPRRSVLARAHALGAKAVVSAYLETYNADPSGAGRERDAIAFRSLPAGTPLPVIMISPRSLERIEEAVASDPLARLEIVAKVRLEPRKLRTLVAVVRGSDRPGEAVAIASHVQEPGACDNASGVAGLLESALGLASLLRSGELQPPSRSLVFLWGDEFRQSTLWLERTEMRPIAGLSSDMTGESRERTGAILLLERMPDPAVLLPLPPDEHTPWGRMEVAADSLVPNGVALIARCALADVAQIEGGGTGGGWETAEHPYEGGSDHDVFIERKIPAALFWHFTDFTYHTSLDRLEMVDVAEMRRTAAAILSTALALADPEPTDLDRYLRSLNQEQVLRVAAAEERGEAELAKSWREWCLGARQWLRAECLRIPESER
ncbi:MAG TPA: M28 family peptidase [Planctomycetota bacterium]|nr:M28 family peptidase [Planctomycetota bacterium]